ncbi:HIRAN domain-containing protein [Lacticaseibacillus mingshuiensis]|uniref:HIRAN domain-containing protein n=1 Tax=Lacticaseibacillus mingshuiensis TaxID=2799574 RepID=A0ABW4CJ87_9LACO|nr:HIRAN domain-containing protein [Lacticaseibacillus mingshuiensis]
MTNSDWTPKPIDPPAVPFHFDPTNPTPAPTLFPRPGQQDILLTNHHIAGTMHVDDPEHLLDALTLGQQLTLVREHNSHDAFATRIDSADGKKIGYVPKGDNTIFARLLDAGLLVYAKVTYWETRGKWPYIRADFYLRA